MENPKWFSCDSFLWDYFSTCPLSKSLYLIKSRASFLKEREEGGGGKKESRWSRVTSSGKVDGQYTTWLKTSGSTCVRGCVNWSGRGSISRIFDAVPRSVSYCVRKRVCVYVCVLCLGVYLRQWCVLAHWVFPTERFALYKSHPLLLLLLLLLKTLIENKGIIYCWKWDTVFLLKIHLLPRKILGHNYVD